MPVTLESRTRRMQVFHLAHDVCCRDRCACTEVAVVVVAENPRTGARPPKHLNKNVPSSITFLTLERKPGLPSTVLELAQVKAAIGCGYLRGSSSRRPTRQRPRLRQWFRLRPPTRRRRPRARHLQRQPRARRRRHRRPRPQPCLLRGRSRR